MKVFSIERAKSIRNDRERLDLLVSGYPNVVGTMIGLKSKGEKLCDDLAFTVFVRRKVDTKVLRKSHHIPEVISVGNKLVPTDIVQVGLLSYQGPRFSTSLGTWDGAETGSVSCFGKSGTGLFCVTCAHCIAGADRDPNSPAKIALWSQNQSDYVTVGESVYSVSGRGTGVPDNYGFSDAALFSCFDQELIDRAQKAKPIRAIGLPKLGQRVTGLSGAGQRTGTVMGVEQRIGTLFADVVIQANGPGTFSGDSGMLWIDGDGNAVALHAMGAATGPGQGSSLTAAMSAGRAEKLLNVSFFASWL